jgi:hypothetical protein
MEHWKKERTRGVWIKIPIDKSNLIKVCYKYKFIYHHCKENYVMMNKWLPKSKSKLPSYGTTTLGSAGVVIDEERKEILLIIEKYDKDEEKFWKVSGKITKI